MRDYSVPALADVHAGASLADVVIRRAAARPDAVMLRRLDSQGGGWQDVTAGQFRAEVTALAGGLVRAGIEPGDRLGVMSRTRYEWTLIDYAIWAVGAVSVPVYETSSAEQVEWILSDSGARAIFAETSRHQDIISTVRDRLPEIRDVWSVEKLDELSATGRDVSDEELARRRGSRTADDLATIIYTSGTTGRPKGCELTHRNLLANARNAVDGALPGALRDPRCLDHAVPAARALVCPHHRGGLPGARRDPRALARYRHGGRGPADLPADIPARRAARVREALQHRAAAGRGQQGQEQDLRRRGRHGDRVEPRPAGRRAGPGQAPRWRCGTPCSTASSTPSCEPPSAARSGTRSPAARRSGSGSATSSAAPASWCWRATG